MGPRRVKRLGPIAHLSWKYGGYIDGREGETSIDAPEHDAVIVAGSATLAERPAPSGARALLLERGAAYTSAVGSRRSW